MDRSGSKFKNHLDDNLVHLHKNLYISQGDPLYHEKVIRYMDAHSPEAHFKLGEKYLKKGNLQKAQFHYQETLRTYPSNYYSAAKKALKQIEAEIREKEVAAEVAAGAESDSEARSPYITMLLIVLLLLNILLIALYFGADSISKTVSKLHAWSVGKDVTYETTDLPYLIYFSNGAPTGKIESAIHKHALELGKGHPEQNILIYGLASSALTADSNPIPLADDSLINEAFVVAEYNSSLDTHVKIRFLDPNFNKKQPLTAVGANLVRTALNSYIQDFGKPPGSLDQLLQDYPHNYLSFIPLEVSSRTNSVSSTHDGSGGWVYDAASANMGTMFYPNDQQGTSLPFEVLHIQVVQNAHKLQLLSGDQVILEQIVGLGADHKTPTSQLQVLERVLSPQGSKRGVYGAAGLGLGKLAIHGTYDESSLGRDQSLGCIRLSNSDITKLFAFVPKGTKVSIAEDSPVEANENVQRRPDLTELIPEKVIPIHETAMNHTFHWLG